MTVSAVKFVRTQSYLLTVCSVHPMINCLSLMCNVMVLLCIVTEYDDSGRDDDGNVIAEASNGHAAAAATNGTVTGKHRREINKKVW